jgi:hypothetical protein
MHVLYDKTTPETSNDYRCSAPHGLLCGRKPQEAAELEQSLPKEKSNEAVQRVPQLSLTVSA